MVISQVIEINVSKYLPLLLRAVYFTGATSTPPWTSFLCFGMFSMIMNLHVSQRFLNIPFADLLVAADTIDPQSERLSPNGSQKAIDFDLFQYKPPLYLD